jgi:S-adenosyl-L-methionine hydrolase (adenosine-forming)
LIITLTTDFGLRDYYAALLKGAILSRVSAAVLVDITHQVKPYDIVQAAFIMRHAYTSFPDGTVHIVAVDNYANGETNFIAVSHNNHYFLAPDNGIISMILGEIPTEIYTLPYDDKSSTFPIKDVFANAIAHISDTEQPFEGIGTRIEDMVERISLQPVVAQDLIRGVITHIDNYDNAILNIHRSLYERVAFGRKFELYFKRHSPVTQLSAQYSDVAVGETLCLFNSAGFLEIAINMGRAATLLDLSVENPVQIIFK